VVGEKTQLNLIIVTPCDSAANAMQHLLD